MDLKDFGIEDLERVEEDKKLEDVCVCLLCSFHRGCSEGPCFTGELERERDPSWTMGDGGNGF